MLASMFIYILSVILFHTNEVQLLDVAAFKNE
jgi:hypothetical protein